MKRTEVKKEDRPVTSILNPFVRCATVTDDGLRLVANASHTNSAARGESNRVVHDLNILSRKPSQHRSNMQATRSENEKQETVTRKHSSSSKSRRSRESYSVASASASERLSSVSSHHRLLTPTVPSQSNLGQPRQQKSSQEPKYGNKAPMSKGGQLTRHESHYSSGEVREDRRRRRNRESARRARQREKSEREIMEKAYDANELRIRHLEFMVDELSSELRRHNTISHFLDSSPPSTSKNGRNPSRLSQASGEKSTERPAWFGTPF